MAIRKVLILGTGGTIAGRAQQSGDNVGYKAGEVPVQELLAPLRASAPWLDKWQWETRQVAQLDSKDMDNATWASLAHAVQKGLDDPGVAAVVITHGTDTLEETVFFLGQVLACTKPVVLTCAMRPSSALVPDGPQNLLDALAVATDPRAQGVCVVAAGLVHSDEDVSKVHTYRVDAFSSGDAGPLGCVEEGRVRWFKTRAAVPRLSIHGVPIELGAEITGPVRTWDTEWPRVEWVVSHAGATGALVDALLLPMPGVPALAGLVVAGTGNGTVHAGLLAALRRAQAQGVVVWRTTRCAAGQVVPGPSVVWPPAVPLSPAKARIALALALAQ